VFTTPFDSSVIKFLYCWRACANNALVTSSIFCISKSSVNSLTAKRACPKSLSPIADVISLRATLPSLDDSDASCVPVACPVWAYCIALCTSILSVIGRVVTSAASSNTAARRLVAWLVSKTLTASSPTLSNTWPIRSAALAITGALNSSVFSPIAWAAERLSTVWLASLMALNGPEKNGLDSILASICCNDLEPVSCPGVVRKPIPLPRNIMARWASVSAADASAPTCPKVEPPPVMLPAAPPC